MKDLVKIGSETAKGGFANEDRIAEKFNNWKQDNEAKKWLKIMDYKLDEIKEVKAIRIHGYKTDVNIKIIVFMEEATSVQNLSIKKANDDADYNQADKRWVDKYKEMWGLPEGVTNTLKKFTGEIKPTKSDEVRDKRRFFLDELPEREKENLINFFKKNKIKIIADIIKGSGKFAADWVLVTKYNKRKDETTWILRDVNSAMNVFGNGEVIMSPRGSLYIGRITMQRKGGDAGRKTANMLQFKIKPCDLFKY